VAMTVWRGGMAAQHRVEPGQQFARLEGFCGCRRAHLEAKELSPFFRRGVSMMIGVCDSVRTFRNRLRPSSPRQHDVGINQQIDAWSVIARTI